MLKLISWNLLQRDYRLYCFLFLFDLSLPIYPGKLVEISGITKQLAAQNLVSTPLFFCKKQANFEFTVSFVFNQLWLNFILGE